MTPEHQLKEIAATAQLHLLNQTNNLLTRTEALLRLEAQKQMRELQASYEPRRLERYGFRVFSQHDEDGIIQEILQRLSIQTGTFCEFGCGKGLESNCAYLLKQGWTGTWFDGNHDYVDEVKKTFDREIKDGRLLVMPRMITIDNINDLVPNVLDLLSIDVDGEDYHLFRALKSRPKVVVCEYNAAFPPPADIVHPHDAERKWNGTTAYGASLVALNELAYEKGYVLVGTNITGVNAFFIRDDVVPTSRFLDAGLTSLLYNPARYRLGEFGFDGHRSGWLP